MEENLKIKTNYNINKTVLDEFNKLTKSKALNKSGLIELLMKDWIKRNNHETNK